MVELGADGLFYWLSLIEQELLLFAGIFFLVGAIDELAVDGVWAWLRLTGRAKSLSLNRKHIQNRKLNGRAAVFIPAWQEDKVIAHTLAYATEHWKQDDLRIYVGCYRNDVATLEAAMRGAGCDMRVRLVMHDQEGPSTKADCLNRLYAAMEGDERRGGFVFRMVLLHDAEDMVDPAALALLDSAMDSAEFVQLPVLPVPQQASRWVGSHYCEEFAEAHGKGMVVRAALSASLPAAGVGCAFARHILAKLADEEARAREGGAVGEDWAAGPFSVESLTEDYELGMRIAAMRGRSRFLRVRGDDGQLVATRAYFPSRLDQAVRQKARWVHGIAFQGWDRFGWGGNMAELWMRLRDRRGPLSALVLFVGYSFFLLAGFSWLMGQLGFEQAWRSDPLLVFLLIANLCSFAWRAFVRFAFTAHEYGWAEGLRAISRIPVANVIAIMAGRRAMASYVKTLMGAPVGWDKTAHDMHPAHDLQPVPLTREAVLSRSVPSVGMAQQERPV